MLFFICVFCNKSFDIFSIFVFLEPKNPLWLCCLYKKLHYGIWRQLLKRAIRPLTVLTDHKNLVFINSAKRLSSKQACCLLLFSRFSFIISYWPGSRNGKADVLSWMLSGSLLESNSECIILPQIDPLLSHLSKNINLSYMDAFGFKDIVSIYPILLGLKPSGWFMATDLLGISRFLRQKNF